MKAATCRSCGAEIVWAIHGKTRKWTCLDAAPSSDGTWHLVETLTGEIEYQHGERGGRTSHFATCPQARQWRGFR